MNAKARVKLWVDQIEKYFSPHAPVLLRLINDMLDITRINRGTMRLSLSRFDLKDSVAAAVESERPQADAKGLELPSSLPPEVEGDPDRVGQILDNLLRNALTFTSRGSIAVSLRRSGNEPIRDTGVGWSRAELAKCSRPQFQARAAPVADWT